MKSRRGRGRPSVTVRKALSRPANIVLQKAEKGLGLCGGHPLENREVWIQGFS